MSTESKAKRRKSFDEGRSQILEQSTDSLPLGTDCTSFKMTEKLQNRHYRPASSRKLTFAPDKSIVEIVPTEVVTSQSPSQITPIAQSMAQEMTLIFGDVCETFNRLVDFKASISEVSEKFTSFPIPKQIELIKSYSPEFCRELLEAELLNNRRLEEKVKLISKRNYDLERRLEFVETNVERVQKKALDKAQKAVNTLLNRFTLQEQNLLAAKERETQTASALRMSNQSLESARSSLESTVKRQEEEMEKLRKDLSTLHVDQKMLICQRDSLVEKVEKLEKREKELASNLNACGATLQDTKTELRRTVEDLKSEQLENRRMCTEAQTVTNQYRADALNHRAQLQEEWTRLKTKLHEEHEKEVSHLMSLCTEKEREIAEALKRAHTAENRLLSIENDQEEWKKRTSEQLYRKLMAKYRDMAQEFHYTGKENPSSSIVQQEIREMFHTNKTDEMKATQEPNVREKKKLLTKVLSKAVSNMESSRRK